MNDQHAAYAALLEASPAALCAQVDPEMWFPEKGAGSSAAKTLCYACPIRTMCLEYAVAAGEVGVWGGTSENERRLDYGARRRIIHGRGGPSIGDQQRAARRRAAARELELERAGADSVEQLLADLEAERVGA